MKIIEIANGTEKIEDYEYSDIRDLEEVYIPHSVRWVGKHAFYNCRALKKVSICGDLFQIQDGVFKNCDEFHYAEIYAIQGKTACLKNIVADISHEITLLIHYEDGDARLLIPSYGYDFEFNINSRIFHEVECGAGAAYHRCIDKPELNFSAYDFLLEVAKREENMETVFSIAENRLLYPYHLEERNRIKYEGYLEEHAKDYIREKICQNHQQGLRLAGDLKLYREEDMEDYLALANEKQHIQAMAFLMSYRQKHFSHVLEDIDKDFDFDF